MCSCTINNPTKLVLDETNHASLNDMACEDQAHGARTPTLHNDLCTLFWRTSAQHMPHAKAEVQAERSMFNTHTHMHAHSRVLPQGGMLTASTPMAPIPPVHTLRMNNAPGWRTQ